MSRWDSARAEDAKRRSVAVLSSQCLRLGGAWRRKEGLMDSGADENVVSREDVRSWEHLLSISPPLHSRASEVSR